MKKIFNIFRNPYGLILILLTLVIIVMNVLVQNDNPMINKLIYGISALTIVMFWYGYFHTPVSIKTIKKYFDLCFNSKSIEKSIPYTEFVRNESFIELFTQLKNTLHEFIAILNDLGKSNNIDLVHLSKESKLGHSLMSVNDSMYELKQLESRNNWKIEGLAKFAELLREDYEDLASHGFKIISEIVHYTESNHGVLYVKYSGGDGNYLQLVGAYAPSHEEIEHKTIYEGEGLVGQCLIEKEPVILKHIPDDYINVTSGLGEYHPQNIIILPLLSDGEIYGVVELASFKAFPEYKETFLIELSDSIASAIRSIQTNENTNKLLKDSQILTNELQTREEEMRQNMEELAATQEDMERNQIQLKSLFNAIDETLSMVEFDSNGKLINANEQFLKSIKKEEDVIGHYSLNKLLGNSNNPNEIWSKLLDKKTVSGEYELGHNGNSVWIDATFTPVLNNNDQFEKVLMLSKEITAEKKLELENIKNQIELKSHMDAINKTIASCEYDMGGSLVDANQIFLGITGYSLDEIKGKHHFDLIPESEKKKPQTELMWGSLQNAQFFAGEFKVMSKTGKEMILDGTYNPILDSTGKPYKVMMFAQFTTNLKEKHIDLTGSVNALKNSLPILETNADLTFKNANKLYFEKFGGSRRELRGKGVEELMDSSSHGALNRKLENIKNNQYEVIKLKMKNAKGEIEKIKVTLNPVMDLENKLNKIVFVFIG